VSAGSLRRALFGLIAAAIDGAEGDAIQVVFEAGEVDGQRALLCHVEGGQGPVLVPRAVEAVGVALAPGTTAAGARCTTVAVGVAGRLTPATASASTTATVSATAGSPATSAAVSGAAALRGRVLLVEDRVDHQHLTSFVLRRAGLEVEVADDGEVGCRMVVDQLRAGRPYDLILMDLEMPKLSGLDAIERIRAAGHDKPIVAVTASISPADRDRCLALGCNGFAAKPVGCGALLELVTPLLDAGE
jgi:Amt family ammonium transporter